MSILQDIAREEHETEMTPMIDVTFLLLIFFLCTIRFRSLEGKLAAYLPRDAGVNHDTPEQIDPLRVKIDVVDPGTKLALGGGPWSGQGRFRFGTDRAVAISIGAAQPGALPAAAERLAAQHALQPERRITLEAGRATVYADIVGVLDAVRSAGYDDITFRGTGE